MVSYMAFNAGINRLESAFEKKYTLERRDIIQHFVREINDLEFGRIIDRFVASEKALPVPDKFAESARYWISRRPKVAQESEPHEIRHKICQDTGALWVDVDGIPVLHACHCEKAVNHSELLAYEPKAMRLAPFPFDQFKPSKKTGDLASRIADRVAWYTSERRLGERYAAQVRAQNVKSD